MALIYANNSREDYVFSLLKPYIAEWFKSKYNSLTPPQMLAIPEIISKRNVLVSSPTGTGKTLSVFIGIINDLFDRWEKGELKDKIYAIYISPLRSLNNDMRRNLSEPLNEINQLLKSKGIEPPEIRISIRTSDTSPNDKSKMLRKPPHILITTPESFSISIVSPRFREKLSEAEWIVVDEIHEMASSKRGSSLSLFLEIFEEFVSKTKPVRIGLSATISPLEEVAKFLVGNRDCVIVDARFSKPIDIKVISPLSDMVHSSEAEIDKAIYSTLINYIKKHRTTLIFTNTRHSAERVAFKLRKMVGKEGENELIEAHHSSLSRDVRLDVEEKLKKGELKAVVSSTSLELGIDIGYIDLVVLLSSPKSVSRLLQRIGRAGHHIRQVSKGRIIVIDRDDEVECTVVAKMAMERKIDSVRIPKKPLDVLIQGVVACSLIGNVNIDRLYETVKRSYPFKELTRQEFNNVIDYLEGRYGLEENKVFSKVKVIDGILRPKRGTRMIFYLNSGTIPDEAKIRVFTESRKYIGDLEEGFVEVLTQGDIFVLGGKTYTFLYSQGNKVFVKPAEGQRPTVPSWFSEMLPLSLEAAMEIGKFRRWIGEMIKVGEDDEEIVRRVSEEYKISRRTAMSILNYIKEQYYFMDGLIPSDNLFLIEIYDEKEMRYFIFHMILGRRVLDALSRAYALVLSDLTGLDVRISTTDNGFSLAIPKLVDYKVIEEAIRLVRSNNLRDLLERAISRTEMLKRRFRYCAERSFMILKKYKGYETNIDRRQINSQRLLDAVSQITSFPVYRETLREIEEDYMDVPNAIRILDKIENGEIEFKIVPPQEVPSPFSHKILVKEYSDVVLMEDRRKILMMLHEEVMNTLKSRGYDVKLQMEIKDKGDGVPSE